MNILLHCLDRSPPWHPRYREAFKHGFKRHGLEVGWTPADRVEDADRKAVHVLFGPNYWRGTQDDANSGGTEEYPLSPCHYLTVDRCSVGNKDEFVTVGWDGWGGHATYPDIHMLATEDVAARWEKYGHLLPERVVRAEQERNNSLIIGEYPSPCDDLTEQRAWLEDTIKWCKDNDRPCVLRPHPQRRGDMSSVKVLMNADPNKYGLIHTYKSSFGVDCRLRGLPVIAHRASLAERMDGAEEMWRRWLLFTQWHISEVESGEFWEYLKDA